MNIKDAVIEMKNLGEILKSSIAQLKGPEEAKKSEDVPDVVFGISGYVFFDLEGENKSTDEAYKVLTNYLYEQVMKDLKK